ncbi:MAG: peptidylprolyl isomerase [Opitutaceae bacterium]|nr:peptidylprolyl isomerase [Opitutaceae bacterium]
MPLRLLLALLPVLLGPLLRAGDDAPLPPGLYAEFTTPRGVIVAELFYQKTPLAAASFAGLAEGALSPKPGTPFFDGLKFHRVVPNFVVQGGDPLGTGEGDPGYQFADEFVPGLRHGSAGILSMANSGPDSNGSQFFFTLLKASHLNYLHTVFGQVMRGLTVLTEIQQDDTMQVRILRVGSAAQAFRVDPATFNAQRLEAARYAGAPEPGPQAHFDDPARLLPADPPRARHFNFKLANFERATGVRLYARVLPGLPPSAATGPKVAPDEYVQRLAGELGIASAGVLAVYFADLAEWQVWICDPLLPAFNPGNQCLPDRKHEFHAAVKTQADILMAEAQAAQNGGRPLPHSQCIKYSVDAMLEALIDQFEPKAK